MSTKAEILRAIRTKCLDCSCYQPQEASYALCLRALCIRTGPRRGPQPFTKPWLRNFRANTGAIQQAEAE